MSAGISPSGVASLRARFEKKDESTSPPSRGRSPAASLSATGETSRPISKVRTSFFSVEPSGQMRDLDAPSEMGREGHVPDSDGPGESTTDGNVERPNINGIDLNPDEPTKTEADTLEHMKPNNPPEKNDSAPPEIPETSNGAGSIADLDNSNLNVEDKTPAIAASYPKETAAVSTGAAREGETLPLGSILKGSPFEQDANKGEALNAPEVGAASEPAQSSEQHVKSSSTPTINGKPKEALAQNVRPQSKSKTTPRPSSTVKSLATQPGSPTTKRPENKPHTSTPVPTTPKMVERPSKQPISKKISSPKSVASTELNKGGVSDARKTTVERPSRLSVAPKAPAAASKAPPKPAKKPGPASPPSFTKPRPKSPTRPVRLPGSATAPTAASAAKVDTAPAATAKPRDRVLSNPTTVRQKPARTSLPAGSKPTGNAKDKLKSRLSTASSKAPEGSFLDRMMRPTQSSSQKTHDKVEAKTPPKKVNGVRPKRSSDGNEIAKNEHVGTNEEQPLEAAPSPSVQTSAVSSESPKPNGAKKGNDEIAPASAAPTPMQQSEIVAGADSLVSS